MRFAPHPRFEPHPPTTTNPENLVWCPQAGRDRSAVFENTARTKSIAESVIGRIFSTVGPRAQRSRLIHEPNPLTHFCPIYVGAPVVKRAVDQSPTI
jgi:hypothetical protein